MKRSELKWMVCSWYFLLSVLMICVFCFVSPIFMADNGVSYSLVELMGKIQAGKDVSYIYIESVFSVLYRSISGYLPLFIPVVSSLPLMLSVYFERESRFKRLSLSRRKSIYNYVYTKFYVGLFAGGLILVLGILIFHFLLVFIDTVFLELGLPIDFNTTEITDYLRFYCGVFFYGMSASVLGGLSSFLFQNIYFVICLPFLLTYMYDLGINYLSKFVMRQEHAASWIMKVLDHLHSYAFVEILSDGFGFLFLSLLFLILLVVSSLVLRLLCRRKTDIGE